jgi:hypothetical protein
MVFWVHFRRVNGDRVSAVKLPTETQRTTVSAASLPGREPGPLMLASRSPE